MKKNITYTGLETPSFMQEHTSLGRLADQKAPSSTADKMAVSNDIVSALTTVRAFTVTAEAHGQKQNKKERKRSRVTRTPHKVPLELKTSMSNTVPQKNPFARHREARIESVSPGLIDTGRSVDINERKIPIRNNMVTMASIWA